MPQGRGSTLKDPSSTRSCATRAPRRRRPRASRTPAGRPLHVGAAAASGDYDDWTSTSCASGRRSWASRLLRQAQGGTHLDAAQPLRWPPNSPGSPPSKTRGSAACAPAAGFRYIDPKGKSGEEAGRRARPRPRHPARLGAGLDLRAPRRPHPGRRHRPEGPQAVHLPPGLGRAPRQGEVRAGAAARRRASPGARPGDRRPARRGARRGSGCWPRRSACSTRPHRASGRRAISRPTAAGG